MVGEHPAGELCRGTGEEPAFEARGDELGLTLMLDVRVHQVSMARSPGRGAKKIPRAKPEGKMVGHPYFGCPYGANKSGLVYPCDARSPPQGYGLVPCRSATGFKKPAWEASPGRAGVCSALISRVRLHPQGTKLCRRCPDKIGFAMWRQPRDPKRRWVTRRQLPRHRRVTQCWGWSSILRLFWCF